MKLKINSVPGYSGVITVKIDSMGVPLERFWRNRLKDAETDNCCEIVKARKSKSKQEQAE